MPRFNRVPERKDYSGFLEKLQKPPTTHQIHKAQDDGAKECCSTARARILSDDTYGFAYDQINCELHDKACSMIRKLPDERLHFLKQYEKPDAKICEECCLKLCLRVGAKDPQKYKEYKEYFERAGCNHVTLRLMYLDIGLITRIQGNVLLIQNGSEHWKIELVNSYGRVRLWHNNYKLLPDGTKHYQPGCYHDQKLPRSESRFPKAIFWVINYSHDEH